MVADFVREYHLTPEQIAVMGSPEFSLLLRGLSHRSRFVTAWTDAPKHVYDPDQIEAIKAAARR